MYGKNNTVIDFANVLLSWVCHFCVAIRHFYMNVWMPENLMVRHVKFYHIERVFIIKSCKMNAAIF